MYHAFLQITFYLISKTTWYSWLSTQENQYWEVQGGIRLKSLFIWLESSWSFHWNLLSLCCQRSNRNFPTAWVWEEDWVDILFFLGNNFHLISSLGRLSWSVRLLIQKLSSHVSLEATLSQPSPAVLCS